MAESLKADGKNTITRSELLKVLKELTVAQRDIDEATSSSPARAA